MSSDFAAWWEQNVVKPWNAFWSPLFSPAPPPSPPPAAAPPPPAAPTPVVITASLAISPAAPTTEDRISASGTLLTSGGQALAGAPVYFTLDGTFLANPTTDQSGAFAYTFGPLDAGSHTLLASYNGSSQYGQASKSLVFAVSAPSAPPPPPPASPPPVTCTPTSAESADASGQAYARDHGIVFGEGTMANAQYAALSRAQSSGVNFDCASRSIWISEGTFLDGLVDFCKNGRTYLSTLYCPGVFQDIPQGTYPIAVHYVVGDHFYNVAFTN